MHYLIIANKLMCLCSDLRLFFLPCRPEIVLLVAQEHPASVRREYGVGLRVADREGVLSDDFLD